MRAPTDRYRPGQMLNTSAAMILVILVVLLLFLAVFVPRAG